MLAGLEAIARGAGFPWSRARVILAQGEAARGADRSGDARKFFEQARAEHGFRLCEADALDALAEIARQAGRGPEVPPLLDRAAAIRADCLAGLHTAPGPAATPPAPAAAPPEPAAAPRVPEPFSSPSQPA